MNCEVTDKLKEECGVFGIWNHEDASQLAYLGLFAIQHRGQESAGIVSLNEGSHLHHKGLGLVGDVFQEQDLNRLKGRAAIGHVRYSTTGENLLTNAQPLTANLLNGPVALAHNGNIVNSVKLKLELQKRGSIFQGTNDTEILLHLLSLNPSNDLPNALKESVNRLEGAYSLVVLSKESLIAVRDPKGFRPLVLGKKKNQKGDYAWIVTSETCVFDLIDAEYVREVEPGELICIDENGLRSEYFTEKQQTAKCVFEYVYFSRPDSVVFGKSVYETRKKFGEQLAKENKIKADLVIPIPDSGVAAALGFSRISEIPFELGIIRNHYVGRTFIQPHQSVRDFGVKIKLNPQSEVLKNKSVVVIDDSLVRGTTSKKIINLIRAAGAKEVHMLIACPPTVSSCFYGVDTPQKSQLIAANQSIDSIREFIGADSLSYLSLEGMFEAVKDAQSFCAACFNGKYPTSLYS